VHDAIIQETSCNTALKAMDGLNDTDRKFIEETYYNANSIFEFGIGESTDVAAVTNLLLEWGQDGSRSSTRPILILLSSKS
jgi:hypothetical protein